MKLPNQATRDQIKRYDALLRNQNMHPAVVLYAFCLLLDIPYDPEAGKNVDWDFEHYCDALPFLAESASFADGVTDLETLVEYATDDAARWLREWGRGDENNQYTEDDYRRLDRIFSRYAERLLAAGGLDAQQEDTLRHCSRMALLRDKCISKGDKESIDKAAKLDKMIQDNLSSENLRKKDAKPVENARIDGIVEALQKKYRVSQSLTQEEAAEVCARWLVTHHYSMTSDAADHSLLSIINLTRSNNDMEPLTELPDEFRLARKYDHEFEKTPSQSETEAYQYIGIKRRPKFNTEPEDEF